MSTPANLEAVGLSIDPATKLTSLLEHTLSSAAVGLFYMDLIKAHRWNELWSGTYA